MLSVELWVPISAMLAIILQAGEARKLRSKAMFVLMGALPVAIAMLASDTIVQYSITHLHQFIAEYGPLIGLFCLLEALIVSMGKARFPIPMVSCLAGLIYLQMYVYQAGWLNWDFDYMAITFGCFISLVMVLAKVSLDELLSLAKGTSAMQFLIVGLAFAQLPGASSRVAQVSFDGAINSVSVFIVLVGLGFMAAVFKASLFNKGRV